MQIPINGPVTYNSAAPGGQSYRLVVTDSEASWWDRTSNRFWWGYWADPGALGLDFAGMSCHQMRNSSQNFLFDEDAEKLGPNYGYWDYFSPNAGPSTALVISRDPASTSGNYLSSHPNGLDGNPGGGIYIHVFRTHMLEATGAFAVGEGSSWCPAEPGLVITWDWA